jgi:hypothetical protein
MAEFNLWLLIVGIAAGAAVMWLVIGTLARQDDEVGAAERGVEAGWIARTIEEYGGRAPVQLVEQILTLHRQYLQGGPGVPLPEVAAAQDSEASTDAPLLDADEDADAAQADASEADRVGPMPDAVPTVGGDEDGRTPAEGTPRSKARATSRRTAPRRAVVEGARDVPGSDQ